MADHKTTTHRRAAERKSSPMTAPLPTLESPEPLAGQSLGAAPCSASRSKYKIIYADPPWSYSYTSSAHGGRSQLNHYDTMRCVEIYDLPVASICDENAVLFMWAAYPMLPEALYTMKAWGFRYKNAAFNWVKLNPKSKTPFFGMGQWTRTNSELCLLGVRGDIKRVSKSVSQIVMSEIERHSRKPQIIREKIVELIGDLPRIELFARERVAGWDAWGNEVQSDVALVTPNNTI